MADIPTKLSTGLPQRPIQRAVRPVRAGYAGREKAAQAQFFGALSEQGMALYEMLQKRDGADQLVRAQNDVRLGLSKYGKWQRDNPLSADIELAQFSQTMDESLSEIKTYLKEKSAQREFDDWYSKNQTAWADTAIEKASTIDTEIKRSAMFARHNQMVAESPVGLTEKEILAKQEALTANLNAGLAEGLWRPDEVHDDLQRFIIEGYVKLEQNWLKVQKKLRIEAIWDEVKQKTYEDGIGYINNYPGLENAERTGLITRWKREETLRERVLEQKREQWRDLISDSINASTVVDIPEGMEVPEGVETIEDLIEVSLLDEKEQVTQRTRARQEAERLAKGEDIVTNEPTRSRLYTMALNVWGGNISLTQFKENLTTERFDNYSIDDAAYKSLSETATKTEKTSQNLALRKADQEAGRLIIDYREEDALKQFVSDVAKGLKPDAKRIFVSEVNEIRQLQFWYLFQYNKELEKWIEDNPDKIGKDFDMHAERLKHRYWNTSDDAIKTKKLEYEKELLKPDYDYEAAKKAGVKPDEKGHWPSQFKSDESSERYVRGLDTKSADFRDVIKVYVEAARTELGVDATSEEIVKKAKQMAKDEGWKVE